jgi:hypothetical protein
MDWIHVAQDRDQWPVLVNTVINLRILQNCGKFLNSGATGNFPIKLGSIEVFTGQFQYSEEIQSYSGRKTINSVCSL